MRCIRFAALAALCLAAAPAVAEIESYAIVQDDASLRIRGKTIHLFGVHVPSDATQCRTVIRPARCASRAALALDFKIQSFVRCREVQENRDGSIDASHWRRTMPDITRMRKLDGEVRASCMSTLSLSRLNVEGNRLGSGPT